MGMTPNFRIQEDKALPACRPTAQVSRKNPSGATYAVPRQQIVMSGKRGFYSKPAAGTTELQSADLSLDVLINIEMVKSDQLYVDIGNFRSDLLMSMQGF